MNAFVAGDLVTTVGGGDTVVSAYSLPDVVEGANEATHEGAVFCVVGVASRPFNVDGTVRFGSDANLVPVLVGHRVRWIYEFELDAV